MSAEICLKCVEKIRDHNDRIREYGLIDDNGSYYQFTPDELRVLLNNSNYHFVNLRLDGIGRIIGKPEHCSQVEYKDCSDDEILEAGFRACAAALKQGLYLEFCEYTVGSERKVVYPEEFVEAMSSVINIDSFDVDIARIVMKFDQYLKGASILPYKLGVLHKDYCFQVISYSLYGCTVFIDKLWNDFIRENIEYYLDQNNYRIAGIHLGNSECQVHITTSQLQGFKALHVIELNNLDEVGDYSDLTNLMAMHRGFDKCYSKLWAGEQIEFEQNKDEKMINLYDNSILDEMRAVGYHLTVSSMVMAKIFHNYLLKKDVATLKLEIKSKDDNIHSIIFSLHKISYSLENKFDTLLKHDKENLFINNYDILASVIGAENIQTEMDRGMSDAIICGGIGTVEVKMIYLFNDDDEEKVIAEHNEEKQNYSESELEINDLFEQNRDMQVALRKGKKTSILHELGSVVKDMHELVRTFR